MGYRRLFLFLEGDDDERFFQAVLVPRLLGRYDDVRPVQVSQLTKKKVSDWLRSVQSMGADYLYVRDLDRHPCATAAKAAFQEAQPLLDPARILVVKAEIESWYSAGIGPGRLAGLDVATCPMTESITKERFEAALPGGRANRIPVLLEILERYDVERAVDRNSSLRYFLLRHGVPG